MRSVFVIVVANDHKTLVMMTTHTPQRINYGVVVVVEVDVIGLPVRVTVLLVVVVVGLEFVAVVTVVVIAIGLVFVVVVVDMVVLTASHRRLNVPDPNSTVPLIPEQLTKH
jgi:hypothetical protein